MGSAEEFLPHRKVGCSVRLSEAIRLGAMLRPQTEHFYFQGGKSCALGGALEATGTLYGDVEWANDDLKMRWPWVFTTRALCPDTLQCPVCENASVRNVIARLNNEHRWTREQIADWVEVFEAHDQPDSAPAVRLSTDQPIVTIREASISSS